MTANVPNPASFLSVIGVYLTGVRDSFINLDKQREYISANGGLTFLTTAYPDGLGMSTTDAQALIATLDQHHDLNVGYGGGPAAPVLNYRDNGAKFWGGT